VLVNGLKTLAPLPSRLIGGCAEISRVVLDTNQTQQEFRNAEIVAALLCAPELVAVQRARAPSPKATRSSSARSPLRAEAFESAPSGLAVLQSVH